MSESALNRVLSRSLRLAWASLSFIVVLLGVSLCAQDAASLKAPSREDLQLRYEKAAKLYADKNWHDAAEEFRWLSTQAAGSLLGSFAMVYEADCLAEDGEADRAIALLSGWLAQEAERIEATAAGSAATAASPEWDLMERARLRLAELAMKLGNVELSVANYRILSEGRFSVGARGRALLALGRYCQSQGDWQQASGYYSQVLAGAEYREFHDVAKLGDLTLQLASTGSEAAQNDLQLLAERAPPSSVSSAAAFQLAQHLYSKAQYELAYEMYEKVIAFGGAESFLPNAYIGASNSLYQLERKEESLRILVIYLEKFPVDPNWTPQAYQFIRWQLAAGDNRTAESWLERLHDIGFATDEEEVRWLRVRSLWGRAAGEMELAKVSLQTAVGLSSGSMQFELRKELLALLLEQGGDGSVEAELVKWIEEYLAQGDTDSRTFFEIKRLEYLVQKREWHKVLPLVEGWLAENEGLPQRGDVLLIRAQCEIGVSRIDDARTTLSDDLFKLSSTADRLKAQAMWLTGETHFLQKDYLAAVAAYSQVVQNYQDVKWKSLAMLQAGKCYEIAGQSHDAISLYEEALKLSPPSSVKKQLELRLYEAKQTETSSLTPASRKAISTR